MKYTHRLAVRFADTDANGHVFFANYLTYFDQALIHYLKEIGYGFQRFTEQGLTFYYVEALTRFKAGAGFDQLLDISAAISRFGRTSFTAEFEIHEAAGNSFINSGHIVSVIVDQTTGNPVPIPEDFKTAVRAYDGS
ncbi:MAG: acyl-CoA thioesterase [Desulfohalobiaceae bacterium]|nr:acyl-CoA thioesterase [Desulfohalobiaceae bacterium]